jgi:hypothetical protein
VFFGNDMPPSQFLFFFRFFLKNWRQKRWSTLTLMCLQVLGIWFPCHLTISSKTGINRSLPKTQLANNKVMLHPKVYPRHWWLPWVINPLWDLARYHAHLLVPAWVDKEPGLETVL